MISVSIPNVRQIVHDDEKYTVKKSIETPDFPPKKMRSLSMKGIEQRRQALETYLQELLAKNNVPKSLLTFLKVKNFKTVSYDSLDELGKEPQRSHHQPVMSCQSDAYLYPPSCNSSLPDSLDKGVRLGLYEDTVEVT
ncbi:sorting nexin-22-like isoform X3 [Acanthaster planci]|uniref:Sorting nexin-22-like isoform X3 n=1 Tax=Acanthaster planci TaxID=133434 RepID=A0A8B8A2B6_ACAPL|nr:sorting nexin-22-like isoform X3 [Acanthaster planci]